VADVYLLLRYARPDKQEAEQAVGGIEHGTLLSY
jgi:hypothetical protein